VACTDTGAPWSLWLVNFVTSALVLGCAIIYGGKKSAIHYTTVAALGMLVAASYFLIVELSHPYIGEISTSPERLRAVIQVLSPRRKPSRRRRIRPETRLNVRRRGAGTGPCRGLGRPGGRPRGRVLPRTIPTDRQHRTKFTPHI
jgi:hypothetical protein